MRDLRVVLALGESGTTSAAAKVLHLTQSAVSRALGVAESHAGVPLFTRTAQGLIATEAGETVMQAAPGMLAELSALERRIREPPSESRRRVRFVAECYMAYPWLAQVWMRLRERAPHLALQMPIEHSGKAPAALESGAVDAALITSPAPRGMLSEKLFTDELIFVVAAAHPLADKGHLEPDDLLEHGLLTSTARASDRWFMRQVFGRKKVKLESERFPVTEAIVEFARAGLGIAVLSDWVGDAYLHAPDAELRVLRLRRGPLRRAWTLACTPEAASAMPALSAAIREACPSPS